MSKKAIIWKLLLGFSTAVALVAAAQPVDKKEGDQWIHVKVKGSGKWFTLAELRNVSNTYLLKHETITDLRKFLVTANLYNDDRNKLVTFQYFENFGLPVYYVTLNRVGEVSGFTNRIASEDIEVTRPPSVKPSK